ncbi:MAG TPA: hypothetical protein VN671_02110 [Solirubrobacterales bacterium]|nr:hypothetical protein [Solirubrobacterales bacterium]
MWGVRLLIVLAAAAALAPTAAAAAPRVYVASDPAYSVAFAEEGGQVSLLGLDTKRFCGYTEPTEPQKPRPYRPLAAPLPMRASPTGLIATVDESEMLGPARLALAANFSATALSGEFTYEADEGPSYRCQSGTYYPGTAAVPFEAVPYVRFGEPGAATPAADEAPDYFGRKGPLEVFIRTEGGVATVRGAVVSKCRFGGDRKSTRAPLFGVPYAFKLDGKASFSRQFKKNAGRVKGDVVTEVTRISAKVGEAAISGSYFRSATTGEGASARKCTIGPLRFRADRYLPPAA